MACLAVCVDTHPALIIRQMIFREFLVFSYMSGILHRKQPDELALLSSLRADGEVEAREVAGDNVASERQSRGWTHMASTCHPIERAPWALACTLSLSFFLHCVT